MKKVEGVIVEGEKIGLEKFAGRDQKMVVNLHILNGFESLKLNIKDSGLMKTLEEYPNRKPIRIKVNVHTYKDELYLQAVQIIN